MKKSNLRIVSIVCLMLALACQNTGKEELRPLDKQKETTEVKEEVRLNESISQIETKINDFINLIDSEPRSRELRNIILVKLQSNDSCTAVIESNYYYPQGYDGFIVKDHYAIFFYDMGSCKVDLIDKGKFEKEIPDKFKSEEKVQLEPFEPYIEKYRVLNKDSMKLISKSD